MTFDEFRASLAGDSPAPELSASLRALWWAENGNWDAAHRLVQDDESADAAWVHAYLHRVEGDLPNARYWYSHAGQKMSDVALSDEWRGICEAFLAAR